MHEYVNAEVMRFDGYISKWRRPTFQMVSTTPRVLLGYLTNDPHIREDGENIAPAETSQFRPSLEQTSRGIRKERRYKFKHEGADDLNQRHGTHAQALQKEVGNVEVRGFGQIFGQKILD